MQRWLIPISEAQLERLSPEDRTLGTLVAGHKGEHFLVFLDDFVALRVANRLGLKRIRGRTAPPHTTLNGFDKALATFDNGDVLLSQPH